MYAERTTSFVSEARVSVASAFDPIQLGAALPEDVGLGSTPVQIEAVELPSEDLERAREAGSAVVILPRRRADDGRGVYGEATLFLVKELRANGIDAEYLDSGERLFEVKKSALVAAVATIALGIASAGAWDAIKALLRREVSDRSQMEITYTDLRPNGTGRTWTVRGRGEEVITAIDKLQADGSDGVE